MDVAVRATNLELTGTAGHARDRPGPRPGGSALPGRHATWPAPPASRSRPSPGSYADAATIELPVYTPATTEAFATYGVIDEGAVAQPVAAPTGVFPQYGGLEITTSSTALQALTDAVLYLVSYPFECSEQLASRILAVAALRDVLTAFEADGLPSPAEMEAAVAAGYRPPAGHAERRWRLPLLAPRLGFDPLQHHPRRPRPAPGASRKASAVPADMQQRALEYLRQIESYYPSWYEPAHPPDAQRLCPLRAQPDGRPRPGESAASCCNEAGLENLSLEAIGWLWPVLQDAPGAERPAGGDPPLREQPRGRDRRRGQLHHRLRRPDLPAAQLRPPHRCHPAGCPDRRQPAERPDPQGGQRPAGAPHQRALGQHPGECLCPAGAGPLLQHLRSPDARLRGPHLAGRHLCRQPRVPAGAPPSATRPSSR